MTATKKCEVAENGYPASVDHNAAMIEELRADPDYANAYLANAVWEEINEPRWFRRFSCCPASGHRGARGGFRSCREIWPCPSEYLPRIIPERESDHHNTCTTYISQ